MPKCKFIIRTVVQNAGCVFDYFYGEDKNNLGL